jgi:hypothetical protein
MRDCWLDLTGVTVESPRGLATDSAADNAGYQLAPHATFLAVDSFDSTLPGSIFFFWNASDVLKNDGDTVSVKQGSTTIDSLTYPAFDNLEVGRSIAFPSDCIPADRADWQRWSLSFSSWTVGLFGTPNAPNDDVACY